MILYSDLDEVLISPLRLEEDRFGLVPVVARPGVERFLGDLSKHGNVVLLSWGTRAHVERGIKAIGRAARFLRGVVAREDLAPIAQQIEVVGDADISEEAKLELYHEIPPILPPGFVFDDFPVGSWVYAIKGIATGTPPERWIQVEAFEYPKPDRGGLRKAYVEFQRRLATWNTGLSGKSRRHSSRRTA